MVSACRQRFGWVYALAPRFVWAHRPGMVGWDSSPRGGRVTHRGPDSVGLITQGWLDGRVTHRGPDLVGLITQ
eukprot:3103832-Prymnesium_polylepis.1